MCLCTCVLLGLVMCYLEFTSPRKLLLIEYIITYYYYLAIRAKSAVNQWLRQSTIERVNERMNECLCLCIYRDVNKFVCEGGVRVQVTVTAELPNRCR